MPPAASPDPVPLYAAGSLRAAMNALATAFTAESGIGVACRFGPSGSLRREIEAGAAPGVFASADMGHPRALAAAGRSGPTFAFAQNPLCLLARPGLVFAPGEALARMLDPALRLGIAAPGLDPSGDYALAVFDRAETLRPGAAGLLRDKALILAGTAAESPSAQEQSPYAALIAQHRTDLFLTYRTNASAGAAEVHGASLVVLPPALAVEAEYGLCLLDGAPEEAHGLADFVRAAAGRALLTEAGFALPPV